MCFVKSLPRSNLDFAPNEIGLNTGNAALVVVVVAEVVGVVDFVDVDVLDVVVLMVKLVELTAFGSESPFSWLSTRNDLVSFLKPSLKEPKFEPSPCWNDFLPESNSPILLLKLKPLLETFTELN